MTENTNLNTQNALAEEEHLDRRIGLRLTALRVRGDLSIAELAKRTGLPAEELAEHESGALPLAASRIGRMALGMGMSREALIEELVDALVSPGWMGCLNS